MLCRSLFAFFLAAGLSACGSDADSGQPDAGTSGADAAAADASADAGATGPLDVLWQRDYVLQVEFAPALAADGTIVVQGKRSFYSPDDAKTVVAFDADGELLWGANTEPGAVPAPPVSIAGDVVYAPATVSGGDLDGRLYRFDLATGADLGGVALTGPVTDAAAIAGDGTVYVPATPLQAVEGDAVSWSYAMVGGGKTGSNAAIGPSGTIYVGARGLEDHNLHAVDVDGNELWKRDVGAAIIDPIAVGADETVYALSGDGLLVAYDSAGELVWDYQLDSGSSGGGIVLGPDDTVYVGTIGPTPGNYTGEFLYAVRDGELVWQALVGLSWVSTTPALSAGGTLYVADFCRGFHAVRASDGVTLASFQVPGLEGEQCATFAAPTIALDGTVYVWSDGPAGGEGGGLYAFRGDGTGPAASAWPQEGASAAHENRALAVETPR